MHGLSTAIWRAEPCTACSALLLLTDAPQRSRPDLRAHPDWNLRSEAAFHSPTTTTGSPVRHSEVTVPGLPASHSPEFPRTRSNSTRMKKPVTRRKPPSQIPLSDSVSAFSAARLLLRSPFGFHPVWIKAFNATRLREVHLRGSPDFLLLPAISSITSSGDGSTLQVRYVPPSSLLP